MDLEAREAAAKSLLLNTDTARLTECIAKGVDYGTLGLTPDDEGYVMVGRYVAGKGSAYVRAHSLRQRWPNLMTHVKSTGEGTEWKAELWIKRKDDTDGE